MLLRFQLALLGVTLVTAIESDQNIFFENFHHELSGGEMVTRTISTTNKFDSESANQSERKHCTPDQIYSCKESENKLCEISTEDGKVKCTCKMGYIQDSEITDTLVCNRKVCSLEELNICRESDYKVCTISTVDESVHCTCKIGYIKDSKITDFLVCNRKVCSTEDLETCKDSDNKVCTISTRDESVICTCKMGYVKDSENEDKLVCKRKVCSTDELEICKESDNKMCTISTEDDSVICTCKMGYVKDPESTDNFVCNRKVCSADQLLTCKESDHKLCEISTVNESAICTCRKGYKKKPGEGDNLVCERKVCSTDQLSICSDSDNKLCEISTIDESIKCTCKKGYKTNPGEGDNFVCERKVCSADQHLTCKESDHKLCEISTENESAVCTCRKGYKKKPGEGDNLVCERKVCSVIQLLICRDFDNKLCEISTVDDSINCTCKKGYKRNPWEGANFICEKQTKCEEGSHTCHTDSTTCVALGNEDYYCECKTGFKLDDGIAEETNKDACIRKVCSKDQLLTCSDSDHKFCEISTVDESPICTCKKGYGKKPGERASFVCERKVCSVDQLLICSDSDNKLCEISTIDESINCTCKKGFKTNNGEGASFVCERKVCSADQLLTCKESDHKLCEISTVNESANCTCRKGYGMKPGESDNFVCEKITKCNDGKDTCPKDSTMCQLIGEDDFYCKCKDGFVLGKGKEILKNKGKCEIITRCNDGKDTCPKDSTVCKLIYEDGFYCECKKGFMLEEGMEKTENKGRCQKKTKCNDGSDKCPKDSTKCVVHKDDYYCDCLPGLQLKEGKKKEDNKEECINCYCGANSVACFRGKNGEIQCVCEKGYAQKNISCSKTCKYDRDCLNGGLCDFSNYYVGLCKCKMGYSGDFCQVNNICKNLDATCIAYGAMCAVVNGLPLCKCPPEKVYVKESGRCEDICNSNQCSHGQCEIFGRSFQCRCDEGYTGTTCDVKITTKPRNQDYLIVFAVSVTIIVMLTISTTCFLILLRSGKRNSDKVIEN